MFGKRRLGALAAVVALAAVAGALGGAMATASLGHFGGNDTTASVANHALEASVARLDADIQALKAGADHASKLGMTQFNKTSERLDKVEKAQLEPAAKLAKLSEAVEKLHAAPPVAAAAVAPPAAAKEITGSISPPSGGCAQGRSGQAADGGRLVAARRRQWRRLDRRAAGNFRSLCRRSGAGSRPDRCDQDARTATGWL